MKLIAIFFLMVLLAFATGQNKQEDSSIREWSASYQAKSRANRIHPTIDQVIKEDPYGIVKNYLEQRKMYGKEQLDSLITKPYWLLLAHAPNKHFTQCKQFLFKGCLNY